MANNDGPRYLIAHPERVFQIVPNRDVQTQILDFFESLIAQHEESPRYIAQRALNSLQQFLHLHEDDSSDDDLPEPR